MDGRSFFDRQNIPIDDSSRTRLSADTSAVGSARVLLLPSALLPAERNGVRSPAKFRQLAKPYRCPGVSTRSGHSFRCSHANGGWQIQRTAPGRGGADGCQLPFHHHESASQKLTTAAKIPSPRGAFSPRHMKIAPSKSANCARRTQRLTSRFVFVRDPTGTSS